MHFLLVTTSSFRTLINMNKPLPLWLLQHLVGFTPSEVYEEAVLNCTDEEINVISGWLSNLMREFDEALIDV